jgi:hypothetical protein
MTLQETGLLAIHDYSDAGARAAARTGRYGADPGERPVTLRPAMSRGLTAAAGAAWGTRGAPAVRNRRDTASNQATGPVRP